MLTACGSGKPGSGSRKAAAAEREPILVTLDLRNPANSTAMLIRGDQRTPFQVGFGRRGVTCAGSRFEEGYTPLGRFRVNGILTTTRFEMEPALISRSGKSEAQLKQSLFKSMNAIDFDGDQQTGEYGIGYISLAPVGGVKQPFGFNTYDGKFRWYSFAIHGSNNDQRVGHQVTGGCLNVSEPVLRTLLNAVRIGDEVVISANGPCTP